MHSRRLICDENPELTITESNEKPGLTITESDKVD